MRSSFRHPQHHPRADLTVWLDPGQQPAPRDLVTALQAAVHLVVVPRTGTRQADVAVLLDPDPVTVRRIHSALPGTVLFALVRTPPSPGLLAAAHRAGVRLLSAAICPEQLLLHLQAGGPTSYSSAQETAACRRLRQTAGIMQHENALPAQRAG